MRAEATRLGIRELAGDVGRGFPRALLLIETLGGWNRPVRESVSTEPEEARRKCNTRENI